MHCVGLTHEKKTPNTLYSCFNFSSSGGCKGVTGSTSQCNIIQSFLSCTDEQETPVQLDHSAHLKDIQPNGPERQEQ